MSDTPIPGTLEGSSYVTWETAYESVKRELAAMTEERDHASTQHVAIQVELERVLAERNELRKRYEHIKKNGMPQSAMFGDSKYWIVGDEEFDDIDSAIIAAMKGEKP